MVADNHIFCTQCGTRLTALHYPDDDYRCPNEGCTEYDKVIK